MNYIIIAILTLNVAMAILMAVVSVRSTEENTRIGCAVISIMHAASAWVCFTALYGVNCP